MDYIINPIVTSCVLALVAGLALVFAGWGARATIAQLMGKLFTRTTFFWLINIVFMAISAYHAAPFFGNVVSTIPGLEWAAQYIGLPVALVIDGVTIVFMQARMEANYKRDDRKRAMYTRYVFFAASLNTIANLYTDIKHFQYTKYDDVGILIYAAPVILSVFPMFLVAISKAADEMVNIKPLEKLNVEEFESQEKKRVEILEVQALYLERESVAMQRLIQIETIQKQNEFLRKGTSPKSFRWFWEKPFEMAAYEAQVADLQQQVADIKMDMDGTQSLGFTDTETVIGEDHMGDNEEAESDLDEDRNSDIDMDAKMDEASIIQFHQRRTPSGRKAIIKNVDRRKSLSVSEAADFLGCSSRQVRRLREKGDLVKGQDDRLTAASVRAYKKKRSARIGTEGA